MNGTPLTLGLVGLAALAGAGRRGSRDALRPTASTALILPELDTGLSAIVLVDASLASRATSEAALRGCSDCVLGFIRLSYPHDALERITNDCDDKHGLGPLEVWNAAARKGWGPLTYDAALWVASDMADQHDVLNGYLVPDRNHVSGDARKIWRYYAEKRKSDVSSRALPKGCLKHGYPTPDPFIDRMYKAKMDAPVFRAIEPVYQRGRELLERLEEQVVPEGGRGRLEREDLEEIFLSLGEELFGRFY